MVRDLSRREIATLLRVTDKTATVWVIEALSALADWRCGPHDCPATGAQVPQSARQPMTVYFA